MIYDVIIVGGGPAGMMAAYVASKRGKHVALLEKNEKLGKKLFITGKGRCNVTNAIDMDDFYNFIPQNSKFLYSAFHLLTNKNLIELLNELGVKTKVERGGRVFPESDKSSDVIEAFRRALTQAGVEVFYNQNVISVEKNDELFQVNCSSESFNSESVIICTGGKSYPITGSTGDGYKFAKHFGHSITQLNASLVPLIVAQAYIKDLQGLSLKNVKVTVTHENKKIYEDFGELLFTHFGLSGPIILSSSFYAGKYLRSGKPIQLSIDLKPALSMDELDKRLLRDFEKYTNKQFKNSLNDILPQKLIPTVINLSEIDPEKEVNQITKAERRNLCELLKNFSFTINATRPIEEAIITSGGVKLSDVNPKTMESKLVSKLYFAGELLDLDAFTGGFNLQIAFSTGYVSGFSV